MLRQIGATGNHALCQGAEAADVEFLNRELGAFLDGVTEGRKKLD